MTPMRTKRTVRVLVAALLAAGFAVSATACAQDTFTKVQTQSGGQIVTLSHTGA